jgi:hypothetical protein
MCGQWVLVFTHEDEDEDEDERLATDRLLAERGALGATGHDPDVLHLLTLPTGLAVRRTAR